MKKLTRKQEENIVVLYASGAWSIRDLAKKYSVSKDTISNILNNRDYEEIRTKSDTIKKEEEETSLISMQEYFKERRSRAQRLLDSLLDIPEELIQKSSLRDRVGAAKYIQDMFVDPDGALEGDKVNVIINLADTSKDAKDGDGE